MKSRSLLSIMVLVAVLMALAGSAEARKLQPGAYISSAKIEILSGEEVRINTAISLLDSLFMYYGPHPEGLYWMTKIETDLMNKASNADSKVEHLVKVIAYTDSLRMSCESKDVKTAYKKDCNKFVSELDSAKVYMWREFYNSAVDKLDETKETGDALKVETDSTSIAYYRTQLAAAIDSVKNNMRFALAVDSMDPRSYIGIASAYEYAGEYAQAMEWLKRALPKSTDKTQILVKIAYLHIQLNEYCNAIPYFNDYCNTIMANSAAMADSNNVATVVATLYNLTICLNNCKQFDSAYVVQQVILKYDPNNADALNGSGLYHNEMARMANDSANTYREAGNAAKTKEWNDRKTTEFEQARVFFKQAFELKPDDLQGAEQYGVVSAVLEKWDEAAVAFARAVILDSTVAENWTSLGDSYLRRSQWAEAAGAYEKAVELKPDMKDVWLNLEALYKQLGDQAKLAKTQAKLKTL